MNQKQIRDVFEGMDQSVPVNIDHYRGINSVVTFFSGMRRRVRRFIPDFLIRTILGLFKK